MNTLAIVTGILQLVSTLEPAGVALVKALLDKAAGLSPTEIAALADSEYAQLGAAADAELKRLG